jgi:hypothetical protein
LDIRSTFNAGGILCQDVILQWIWFHKPKITVREMFGRYAMFSFRESHAPHASRGIWKKCCRAFSLLDVA